MPPGEKYREVILDRIQKGTGFALEENSIPRGELRRIADLAEILHQAMVIEQMVRVEERDGRKLSSRLSTRIRPSRAEELNDTLASLTGVKEKIWKKCDLIATEIVSGFPEGESGASAPTYRASNLMKCHSCGGNISILAYNNFKCSSCGLGYSARDYLENLSELLERV